MESSIVNRLTDYTYLESLTITLELADLDITWPLKDCISLFCDLDEPDTILFVRGWSLLKTDRVGH
jgi:hypothetical protein